MFFLIPEIFTNSDLIKNDKSGKCFLSFNPLIDKGELFEIYLIYIFSAL